MSTFTYTDGMNLGPSSSSVIRQGYYNHNTQVLVLGFQSGSQREYDGVPDYLWSDFRDADSVGTYYNRLIRGNFKSTEVDYKFVPANAVAATQIHASRVTAYDADRVLSVSYPYTVRFSVSGLESVFNTTAENDVEAAREFESLVERLGLEVDTARVERELV